METHVDWTSPSALWHQFNGAADDAQRRVFRTPAILRFTSDAYIQDFLSLMQTDPHGMSERLAVPETWSRRVADPVPIVPKGGVLGKLERARAVVVQKLAAQQLALVRSNTWNAAGGDPLVQPDPLKLYHPASQRYYVVTACLICRTLGLPDRPVNTSAQERVAFVIRRLQSPAGLVNPDPAAYSELAFVNGAWKPVSGTSLAVGEEQNLMSPLTYAEDDGRKRRMHNGVIPVARREAYLGAQLPVDSSATAATPIDPRQMMLKLKVIGPWESLEDIAARPASGKESLGGGLDAPPDPDAGELTRANAQLQNVSWFILIDLDAWLQENLNAVWKLIHGTGTLNDQKEIDAYLALAALLDGPVSLVQALREIAEFAGEIEGAPPPYTPQPEWPAFTFVRATTTGAGGLTGTAVRETLETKLSAALSAKVPATVPVSAIAQINAASYVSPWFTIRCVYERPACGTLSPIVSEPTASFQLASFFDPDAPARAIRVEMPADTTSAGLRKFDKNTSFVMSDVLCGQVGMLRGVTFGNLIRSVLPFPFHKDLNVGGMSPCSGGGAVCSLSIPIITICALVLLMMIVKLLDVVFFWMPFFQICLPVPNFKAKG